MTTKYSASFKLFLLFVLAFLMACQAQKPKQVSGPEISSPFVNGSSHYYKTDIRVKDQSFGGIMAVKYRNKDSFRVSLISTAGSMLLDFEWEGEKFTKHYVMQQMDRKILVRYLKKDFELLFLRLPDKTYRISDTSFQSKKDIYYFEKEGTIIRKIIHKNKKDIELRRLEYLYDEKNRLIGAVLTHFDFDLQFKLHLIAE